MTEAGLTHTIMGGKLHVYKRPDSTLWQCSTYLRARTAASRTKEDSLSHAKDFAEDWYLELRGKSRAGELKSEKTFREAAEQFERNTRSSPRASAARNTSQATSDRLQVHLVPFFGNMVLSEITPGKVQEYRMHRHEERSSRPASRPSAARCIRKSSRCGRCSKPPIVTAGFVPFPTSPRPTRPPARSRIARGSRRRSTSSSTRRRASARRIPKKHAGAWECEQLHDYVLFMANTGLRPDEARAA